MLFFKTTYHERSGSSDWHQNWWGNIKSECESCVKSFSGAQYLKKHIHTVHEGHKDHKCESCSKSFSLATYLEKHIYTIHEGHKDYKCESCGKSFSQAGDLKRHKNSVQVALTLHGFTLHGSHFTRGL